MCPREKHTRAKGIMSMEDFERVLKEVVQYGVEKITLTGFGEPFIDPTLEDKILMASQYGLETYVITNASLFHLPSKSNPGLNRIEACVKNGLTELRLSFYGTSKSEYERIMVGGSFDRALSNLQLLSVARWKFGLGRLSTMTKQHINCPEVSMYFLDFGERSNFEDFKYLASEYVDYYEIWRPHNFGDGRSYRSLNASKRTCGRPQNGPIQINWNGVIVPCCYDYNDAIVLGNIFTTSLPDILRGDAYKQLRDIHVNGEFERQPYCNNCDQLLTNKATQSIVVSTNPKHNNLSADDIVKRTNTSPDVSII
jgi:radical SAM protein with 4Fe4S-binding SPASM domain